MPFAKGYSPKRRYNSTPGVLLFAVFSTVLITGAEFVYVIKGFFAVIYVYYLTPF